MGLRGKFPNVAAINPFLLAGLPVLAEEATALIRAAAPVSHSPERTVGDLRDSLHGEADGWTIRVTTDKEYDRYVREGTEPHEIRAVRAGALRFWMEGGTVVFRKVVHHPGTQPNDYPGAMADAIDAYIRQVWAPDIIDRALHA